MTLTGTRVFMVRHGATVLSAEDRFAGATDVALSDEGREQTRRLAERLSREKIAAVYASPLGRTVETAQILAAPHKLEVQTRDGFREINHGRWEQMTRREVEKRFPEEAAEWADENAEELRGYVRAQPVQSLLINPGGPGGSGVNFVVGAFAKFPVAVSRAYDLIGFDPRGVAAHGFTYFSFC